MTTNRCQNSSFAQRVRRTIEDVTAKDAAVDEMTTSGTQILPSSEFQIRSLARLEPELQQQAWEQAIEEAGGKVPPARVVKDVVERITSLTEEAREESPIIAYNSRYNVKNI